MAKGKVLTAEIRRQIIDTYRKNPTWKAPKIRYEVWAKLKKQDPTIPNDWPSLAAVQAVLRDARRKWQDGPRDKPWSIASMAEYDIPPDALPMILETLSHIAKTPDPELKQELMTKVLTIRVVQWMARLSKMKLAQELAQEEPMLCLLLAAQYAFLERIIEIIGYPKSYEDMQVLWKTDIELATYAETGSWGIRPTEIIEAYRIDPKLLSGEALTHLLGVKKPKEANDESSNLLQSKHRRPRKRGDVVTDTA